MTSIRRADDSQGFLEGENGALPAEEVFEAIEGLPLKVSEISRKVSFRIAAIPNGEKKFWLKATVRVGRKDLVLVQSIDPSLGYVIFNDVVYLFENTESIREMYRSLPTPFGSALDINDCLHLLKATRTDPLFPDINFDDLVESPTAPMVRAQDADNGLLPSVTPYEYQADGIEWLGQRVPKMLSALLADEMGLGKTLQAISMISLLVGEGKRVLIVVPNALTENWKRELKKFAGVECFVYARESADALPSELKQFSTVITTYDTVRTRSLILDQLAWNLVVLDEAQYIKNPDAQRSRAVKAIGRDVGLALTGTPVENRPLDLVSVLDFLIPGAFDDLLAIGEELDPGAVSASLAPVLPQLMLRREVKDVGNHLPDRTDIEMPLVGSDWFYDAASEILRRVEGGASMGQRLAAITELRQLSGSEEPASSPKFQFVRSLIQNAVPERQKIIIFASFNKTIDALSRYLSSFSISTAVITGETQDRQGVVDEFERRTEPSCLIMNPKAGGVGLNITSAPTVVHFEPEWNPAVIDQASARSYRTGQKKAFFCYSLFVVSSIEEYVLTRVSEKREMASELIGPTQSDLTPDGVEQLFRWLEGSK